MTIGGPGPNEPASAYPPANLAHVVIQAPPHDDGVPSLAIVDDENAKVASFKPTYGIGEIVELLDSSPLPKTPVIGGIFMVQVPPEDGQLAATVQANGAMQSAGMWAYDQATYAQVNMNVESGSARVQCANSDRLIVLNAYPDYAQQQFYVPDTQDQPALIITRSGVDKLMIYGNGDIKILDEAAGLILTSPDGNAHRLRVANNGALSTTDVIIE